MKKNNYWFSLKSHIYVEFMDENILIYDTQIGTQINSNDKNLISLVHELYEPKELGVIEISKEKIDCLKLQPVINNLINLGMAELQIVNESKLKPICLIPILNLQHDIDKIKDKVKDDVYKTSVLNKNTLDYLFEINLNLNNECEINCKHCKDNYKQFNHCTVSKVEKGELPLASIEDIFEQIKYAPICSINLLGGNIYKYSNLDKLKNILLPLQDKVHFFVYYKNYIQDDFIDTLNLELLIDFPSDNFKINQILNKTKTNWKIHFIIKDEMEYEMVDVLIYKFNLNKYTIHPLYTVDNLPFFKKYVYLEEEDIFSNVLSMREIFRNQKVNKNFFGKLFVDTDGNVRANMNNKVIGNIEQETIKNIVYKELMSNSAWRKIRDIEPCNSCLNKNICPPISNYELILGKYNLCRIK